MLKYNTQYHPLSAGGLPGPAGGQNFQSQNLKGDDQKKNSAWGEEGSYRDPATNNCLGDLLYFLPKGLLKIKYDFEGCGLLGGSVPRLTLK